MALFFLISLGVLGAFLAYQNWTEIRNQDELIDTLSSTQEEFPAQSSEMNNLSPEQTVDIFYSWYLQYDGNPIVTGAYQTSEFVSDRFKDSIRVQFTDEETAQADPFLLTQDLPSLFEIADTIISDQLASVKVIFTFDQQEVFRQIDLIRIDDQWKIDQVQMIEGIKRATDDQQQMEIIVYFPNEQKAPQGNVDCSLVYGTARSISSTFDLETEIEEALKELFKGPTTQEEQEGFSSFFSPETSQLLNEVKLVDDTAYIDLIDAPSTLEGQNASCAGQALLSQIEETIKHSRQVQKVVVSTNGNAQEFYEWLQLGCDENNNFCQTVFGE
ncbi:MAG: Spore germination protein-like Gmad2 [Microgenomates bacterium 39_7]|nr:MAG: Spore germination protein-like Gmad2 [Microgenomates bacterium 39_7]